MIEPVRKCNKCLAVTPEGRAFTRAAIELISVGSGNRAERFDGDLCSQGCLLAVFKAMLSQEPGAAPDNGRPFSPAQAFVSEDVPAGSRP